MKRVWMVGMLLSLGLSSLSGCESAAPGPGVGDDLLVESDGVASPNKMTLAYQAREDGEYQVALALFREILAEEPTNARAFVGIGEVYVDQDDFIGAEPYYARAARIAPRNYLAQSGYGKVLYLLKRFSEALHSFHKALSIEPRGLEANIGIGATYLAMDEPEHAVVFAEKAVQVNPSNGEARANLGMVYEAIDRHDEAIEQYLIAMELLDDAKIVMVRLSSILIKEKRYREASNTAEALVKIEPTAESFTKLGRALFKLGEYDRSIDAYRRAVKLDPKYWQAHNGVGVNALNAWYDSDKQDESMWHEARAAFRRSLQVKNDQQQVIILMQKHGLL